MTKKERKSISDKIYREKNKEKIKEMQRAYHIKNRDERLLKMRIYTLENKDKITEYQKQYHKENKNRRNAENKRRRDENKEEYNKRRRLLRGDSDRLREQNYRDNNRDKLRKAGKRWRDNNVDKLRNERKSLKRRHSQLKTSSKRRGLECNITEEYYKVLMSEAICHYCHSHIGETSGYALDRVDNLKGYLTDNVVPCCKLCNVMKNNLSEIDFEEHIIKIFNALQLYRYQR